MVRILMRAGRSPFESAPPERVIQQNLIAGNTGNLLFSDAIWKFLSTPDAEITANRYRVDPEDADRINDEYDLFVVPLANGFRPSFKRHLNDLSALIEKLTIPVVVFGVGGQSSLDYGTDAMAPIEQEVRRFCSAVLDRSPSIGVRGEFTQSYLNSLGFTDVDVIGCPSMFMYGRELRVDKGSETLDASSRLAVNVSYESVNIPGSSISGGAINRLVDAAMEQYSDLLYFAQERKDLELLYWGDVSEAAGTTSSVPLVRSHPLLAEDRTRLYFDTPTWIDALRSRDFAFGTRIHGNIAALLAGTPAVVLCHDSRTLELCRYFDIPHQLTDGLPQEGELSELPARLYEEADFSAMVNGHDERFERLVAFMDRHGLDHVHRPGGDGGAAFEGALKGVEFHPGVSSWQGGDDGGLGYRLAWLRDANAQAKAKQAATEKRVRELTRKVSALEGSAKESAALAKELKRSDKRLAELEREKQTAFYRRARRFAKRIVRSIRRRG